MDYINGTYLLECELIEHVSVSILYNLIPFRGQEGLQIKKPRN